MHTNDIHGELTEFVVDTATRPPRRVIPGDPIGNILDAA